MFKGLEHLSNKERLKELNNELGLFSLEEKVWVGGDLINVYLKRGCNEGSFQRFPVIRTGGNGYKPKHRRFYVNIRRHVFTVWVMEH